MKKLHAYIQWLRSLYALNDVKNNTVAIELVTDEGSLRFRLCVPKVTQDSYLKNPIKEIMKGMLFKDDDDEGYRELRVLTIAHTIEENNRLVDVIAMVHEQIDVNMKITKSSQQCTSNKFPMIIMLN